jgi:hypothetical protein
MATNRDVATRFASVIKHKSVMQDASFHAPLFRSLKGSNFRVDADTHRYDRLRAETNDLFVPLVQATSYRTTVAEIVWNNHTKMPELWLDPQKYSDSTQRQVSYLRREFFDQLIEAQFFEDTQTGRLASYEQVYETKAMNLSHHHCRVTEVTDREAQFHYMIKHIKHNLTVVDEPKRHEHTRRRALTDALRLAQYGLRLISQGVPTTYPGHRTLSTYELRNTLQEYIDTFTNLQHIESMDELRIAVRGIQALERN